MPPNRGIFAMNSYFYHSCMTWDPLQASSLQSFVIQLIKLNIENMKKILLFPFAFFLVPGLTAQSGTDLIISEYVEGWSNNKALELYNPTDQPIDLSNYRITRYSNGSTPPIGADNWYVLISGLILPHKTKVFVIDQRNPEGSGQDAPVWDELQARADTFVCPVYEDSYALYFNGDDAVALEKLNDEEVDIFGKIGERPVNAQGGTTAPTGGWTDTYPYSDGQGVILSADHTLVRKPDVVAGVDTAVEYFNILADWDSLPANTFTYLGWHDCVANPDSNQKPTFDSENYAFTISIEDPTGTSVGTVSATDPNGDGLNYYISGGNSYDPFLIDRKTGEIKVAKSEELYWRDYTLTIDVTDGTSPVSRTVDVTVEGGYSGIRDISLPVDIFPNPVTDGILQIRAAEDIALIEIYSLTGKLVMSHPGRKGDRYVNLRLDDTQPGVYMMKIRFRDNSFTARKVLVK
jgi:hypothetical protein